MVPLPEILNFIANRPAPPSTRQFLDNVEPATGRVYSRVASSDAADIEAATQAAASAFPAWSETPAADRSAFLLRIADGIETRLEQLALAESVDQGKPVALARAIDIPRSAANFRFFATSILHTESSVHDMDGQALNYTLRRPRGVAGLISPWNLPLYLFTWKIAPAIAAGNTAVAKPSELTPMTASLLGEICRDAGLPPGVLNIVHGSGRSAGAAIITNPRIPTISFTGGTATGKWIAEHAGPMFKRLSLELGGKNANIIFADADLDAAVETAVRAAFTNQGEICLCGSRILVQRPVFDAVLRRIVDRTKLLRCGDPLDPATDQGALVSGEHRDKVLRAIDLARTLGGTVHCGGVPPARLPERCRDGFFLEPTVISGLDSDCPVNQEEIFGPVATLIPFDDEQAAIRIANSTAYGLAAMIWTRDLQRAHRVAAAVDAGIVGVNCWMLRDLRTPFGGMKQSGVGREGGVEALRFFTEPRNVCIRL